ncbi:unnamed protein product [Ectocarpus sp. CCAP 1310/34]|nr:unnamed protein product [Ectocarpus sp. CCAP 1310/34]
MARCCKVVAVLLVVLATAAGFLLGAPPGPPRGKGKAPQPNVAKNKVEGKPRTTAEKTLVGPSPTIETITVGSPQHGLFIDSEQARAIALEAATSKTVPKATTLEALHSLAHSSELELTTGLSAPLPVQTMEGLWRLCFCEGDFLPGVDVDKHGYVARGQNVEILFDPEGEKITLGSSGFGSSLPAAMQGGLSYTPETQTVTGTFEKAGMESLDLQAFLIDDDALGFHTVSEDKHVILLFHAEKSKAAAARLSKAVSIAASSVSEAEKAATAEAKKAATAEVAGKDLLNLVLDIQLVSEEDVHENKRLAVQETGRETGSFNTFIHYLETEGGMIYAVVAGPILFSYMKYYSPVAASKATAAAIVMVETVKHILKANA